MSGTKPRGNPNFPRCPERGHRHEDDVYDPTADDDRPDRDDTPAEDDGPRISNALLESLTTTLTLAAQHAIGYDSRVALRAAVAALTSSNWSTPVKLSAAGLGYESQRARNEDEFRGVFWRLQDVPEAELMGRFAVVMAFALDLRTHNALADRSDVEALRDALPAEPYLAAARELFNAEDYFARAPKAIAEAALEEMDWPVAKGGKKAEVATCAARCASERGWLPPELRHPAYALIPDEPPAPAETPAKGKRKRRTAP